MKHLKKIICFVLLLTILIPNTVQVFSTVTEEQIAPICELRPEKK